MLYVFYRVNFSSFLERDRKPVAELEAAKQGHHECKGSCALLPLG